MELINGYLGIYFKINYKLLFGMTFLRQSM